MKAAISFQITGLYKVYQMRNYVLSNERKNEERFCYLASQYFLSKQDADKKILYLFNPISMYLLQKERPYSIEELNSINKDGMIDLLQDDQQSDFKEKIKSLEEDFGYETEICVIPYFGVINETKTRYRILRQPISSKTISHFVSYLFVAILKRIFKLKEEGFSEVDVFFFVDTGLNHLVSLFRDAINYVHFCLKVSSSLKYKGFIVSSEPLIGGNRDIEVNVFSEEIGKKLSFDFPFEKIDEKLDQLVKHSFYLFNFLKHNVPLGFLTYLLDRELENKKNDFLKRIVGVLNEEFSEIKFLVQDNTDRLVFLSRGFKNTLIYEIIALAIGHRIVNLFLKFKNEDAEINNNLLIFRENKKIYIQKMFLEKFKDFYTVMDKSLIQGGFIPFLQSNAVFYERDLKNIGQRLPENDNEEINLGKLLENKVVLCDSNVIITKGMVRNFIAHSGFENNVVCALKRDNILYLGYKNRWIYIELLDKFLNK